jgi:hypothetical protein
MPLQEREIRSHTGSRELGFLFDSKAPAISGPCIAFQPTRDRRRHMDDASTDFRGRSLVA